MSQKPSELIREAARETFGMMPKEDWPLDRRNRSLINAILSYLDDQTERNAPPAQPPTQYSELETTIGNGSTKNYQVSLFQDDKWTIVTAIDIERFGHGDIEVDWSVDQSPRGKARLRGYTDELPIPLRVVVPPRQTFSVVLSSILHLGEKRKVTIYWRYLCTETPK